MQRLVDVECERKLPVPFQPRALVVAGQALSVVAFAILRCVTFHFLLLSLALASYENLARAWLIFLAGEWSMTLVLIRMTAHLLRLAARLLASLTVSVFALSRPMTGFAAVM